MYRVHNDRSITATHSNNILAMPSLHNKNSKFIVVGWVVLLIAIHFPSISFSAYLNLPRDSSGWTIFTPSVDTDVIYVDSVSGNDTTCRSYRTSANEMGSDPFNPASAILPCATAAKAITLTGNGQPDWILFKRGSSFATGISTDRSGRSATEPFLIASYGISGAMPVFRGRFDNAGGNTNSHYIAISGLDFYRDTRDPESPNYAPVGQAATGIFLYSHAEYTQKGILIEGCRIRNFLNNVNIAPVALSGNEGLIFRRNLVLDAYSNQEGHSQGILIIKMDGVIFEENILDHNGWLVQSDSDGITEAGEATIFNHNAYLTNNKNMIIRNNIFIRGSSNNTKIKYTDTGYGTGLAVYNNLYLGGEIAISIGAPDEHQNFSTVNPTIDGNVWLNPGMWNPTNRDIAWFFYNFNWDGGIVSNNIMLNQVDVGIKGMFFHMQYSGRNVKVEKNIAYNVKNIVPVYLYPTETGNPDREGFLIANNIFDISGSYIIDAGLLQNLDAYSFSGNKYSSTKDVDSWFKVNSTTLTNSQWQSITNDNSSFEQVLFSDPTKSIETYMASLGETVSIEAFIAKCRLQDRFNWDERYTARAVNAWVKKGFSHEGGLQVPENFKLN